MPDDTSTMRRQLIAKIVSAFTRRNQVAADQLPSVIAAVHQALETLGTPPAEPVVERTPAVPIRRSVQRKFVICLECSWRGQMLKRHLTSAHGLDFAAYRARWNLSADHALVAPAYSERRSTMAKQLGLGRTRGGSAETMAMPETEKPTQPAPRRRGRPRTPRS
jgi:predicted transcriptional regulator